MEFENLITIKNNSDQPQAIWWGNTMFDFAPKDTVKIERVIVEACLKNVEYRPLFTNKTLEITDPPDFFGPVVETAPQPSQGEGISSPKPSPWEGSSWNPLDVPIEEVQDYITHFKLKFVNSDEDFLRQAVDEHYLSND